MMLHALRRSARPRPVAAARPRFRPRVSPLEDRLLLSVDVWNGNIDSNWSNGSNWSLGRAPGTADTADFTAGAKNTTATVDKSFTVAALTIDGTWGGTINVNMALAVTGNFTLASGTLNVNAATSIAGAGSQWSGGSLAISAGGLTNSGTLTIATGGGTLVLTGGGMLTDSGTIHESGGGALRLDNGSTISIPSAGTYDFASDASVVNGYSPSGVVVNAGTVEKTAGAGTSQITTQLDSSGNLTVQTGTLQLATAGGTNTGGVFTVAAGAVLDLTGGNTVAYSGAYTGSGAGTVSLASGTLALAGAATFDFPAGLFQWSGGTLDTRGYTLTNPAAGVITVSTTGTVVLTGGGTLANAGTIDQTGAGGSLRLDNGTTLNNRAGGVYDFASDASVVNGYSPSGVVVNAGTVEKTAGAGTSQITTQLDSSGNLTVQTGTLRLAAAAGGTNTGGIFTVASGAVLDLTGGTTVAYSGAYTGSGAGTVSLANGTLALAGAATFDFPAGLFQWSGGTVDTQGNTLTNAGTLTVSTTGTVVLTGVGTTGNAGAIDNAGTIDQTGAGGSLRLDNGTTLYNRAGGVYDFASDASVVNGYSPSGVVVNAGTVEKTAGAGTSQITTQLDSSGNLTVQTGTLQLATAGGTNTGGVFTVAAGAVLDLTGGNTVAYSGAYTGSGAGTVSLASGTLALAGAATFDFPAGLFQWSGGTLDTRGYTLTNPAAGVITVSTTGTVVLTGGGTLANAGTIDQTNGGSLRLDNGTTLNNQAGGVYDFASDASVVNGYSPSGVVVNAGTVEKTAGTGTSRITTQLDSSGNLTVQTGTLQLAAAGGTNTGGAFAVASGAVLDLTGGTTVAYSGAYTGSGAGTVSLANGTLAVGAGGATFNLSGSLFQWSGGTVDTRGNTLTNAGTLTVSTTGTVVLTGGGTLAIAGTVNQTGAGGTLRLDNGSTLSVGSKGVYDFAADASVVNGYSPAGSFVNAGTLSKTGGTGTSVINVALNNTGVINAASGTLSLQGAFSNFSSTTNTLTGGTYLVSATLQFTNADIVTNAASITLTGTAAKIIDLSNNDALRGFATNAAAGVFTIQSGRNLTTPGAFSNAGSLTVGAGSTFTATGAYTQSGGSTNLVGGGVLTSTTNTVAINGGLLGGSGTVNGNVTNSGNVVPGGVGGAGILNVKGNYTQTSSGSLTIDLNGANPGTGYGQLNVSGAAALNGTLTVILRPGFYPTLNETFQVLTYASYTGQFSRVVPVGVPAGAAGSLTYTPTGVIVKRIK